MIFGRDACCQGQRNTAVPDPAFSGNPDTRAQAQRLESVLKEAEIPAKSHGKGDSNHSRLNDDLGKPDDPATQEFYKFLDPLIGQSRSADGKRWVDRQ